ncbi:MAG: tyrosine-protein phosphatase [Prevotella sp.]|nr:tyrosine-protein phosphatase [Prevotella sp.]
MRRQGTTHSHFAATASRSALLCLFVFLLTGVLGSCNEEELKQDERNSLPEYGISLQTDYEPLVIDMEGAHNVRDLGGLIMVDGKRLKKGMLYRGGRLDRLTAHGKSVLRDSCGIHSVIDFRSRYETGNDKTDADFPTGIKFISLPLFNSISIGQLLLQHPDMSEETLLSAASDSKAATMAACLYEELLTSSHSQQQLAIFLRTLAATDNGGVLWHCSHGRDRSGVASALLLAALGASKQTIITDFEWGARLADSTYKASSTSISLCSALFYNILHHIEQKYGSIENYLLRQVEFDKEEMTMLRTKYLE